MNYARTVATAAAELEQKIRALLPLLDELEQAMTTECEALSSRDAQALLGAVETKRGRLRALETALERTNLAPLIESLSRLDRAGNDQRKPHGSLNGTLLAAAVPSWSELTERLRRCHALNQAAGGSAAALRRHTEESLGLLGLSAEPCVYGTTGPQPTRVATLRSVVA